MLTRTGRSGKHNRKTQSIDNSINRDETPDKECVTDKKNKTVYRAASRKVNSVAKHKINQYH